MTSKGSITIYICLVMTITISLITTGIYSVRIAAGRLQMVSAVDLGLYSLFGQYEKDILEHYQLLYLDGGYGESALQMSKFYNQLQNEITVNLFSEKHMPLAVEGGSIRGYTLATDNNGMIFKDQVIAYMESTLGAQGMQQLLNQMNSERDIAETQQETKQQADSQEALEAYEQLKEEAKQNKEETQADPPEQESPLEQEFVNPIESIKKVKEMGILMLTVPNYDKVSNKTADLSVAVSKRSLQKGMGIIPYSSRADSLQGNLLFQEYIMNICSNYTDPAKDAVLEYQAEYILQGKNSDMANLKGVIHRLLLMREATNILHLLTDANKKAQLAAVSLTIAAAIGFPQAQQAVEGILMVCWAYGESILDVRELMAGGKAALVKDNSSWQLSVENLPYLSEGLDSFRKSSDTGLSYQGYLRVLLSLKESQEKVMRCMDTVEMGMAALGKQNFRLDNCIAAVEVEMKMKISKKVFTVSRNYGYDM